MIYLNYFEDSSAVGSGVEVDLPNVAYLERKNVLFTPGEDSKATIKYNSSTDEIEAETGPTYEYVDLGLPSGTLWAKTNVGAQTETDYGLYFSWGGTTGYAYQSTAKDFSWNDYELGDGGSGTKNMTKYNSTDGKIELDLTDDAARANMGGNWRMPSQAQLNELKTDTTNSWVTVNGVKGIKFQNKTDSSKYIFIPAAGSSFYGSWDDAGNSVDVWSRSLDSGGVQSAYCMNCYSWNVYVGSSMRCNGFSVRGVIDGNN